MPRKVALLALLTVSSVHCTRAESSSSERGVKAESSPRRGAPRTDPGPPAPAELPDGIPFVGEDGTDEHGYPLRRPDSVGLVTLLRARHFDRLDEAFEHYQTQFESDFRKEAWPLRAMTSFEVADPSLGPLLDAWVLASKGPHARACRGAWHYAMGWEARGHGFAPDTPEENFDAMRREHEPARADFQAALSARPRYLAARMGLVYLARTAGDDAGAATHFAEGLRQCPACFELRAEQVVAAAPRWGGSTAQMKRTADVGAKLLADNPKLALLKGWIPREECRSVEDPEQALPACERAAAVGVHPLLSCPYAYRLTKRERFVDASKLLDAALRLDPQERRCLIDREYLRRQTGDIEGAAADLLLARRLDPIDDDLDETVKWMLDKLDYDAAQAHRAGDEARRDRLLKIFKELSPSSVGFIAPDDQIAALQRQVEAAPDDFQVRRRLDAALIGHRRFDDIIAMWDAFIAGHPEHAEAYAERAGTHWHAGHAESAVADMQKACDLGNRSACADVGRMKAKAGL